MIIHNVQQNTPEWDAARIGIPTASEFEKIISPGGEPSRQWEAYAHKILAEEMIGHAIKGFRSADMEEGQNREEESVLYYELQRDVSTTPVGFVTDDARTMGCSPDRFVGTDGLLETKNPLAHTLVGYMIDGKLDRAYWPQIQGQLLVTGRKWVDIVAYFPEMPEVIVRVERDLPYLESMARMLKDFNAKLNVKRQNLIRKGYMKGIIAPDAPTAPPPKDKWDVLVESIIEGLAGLDKIAFNAYIKKRSDDINNVTLNADSKNRAVLASAINTARKAAEGQKDPSRFLGAG